MTSGHLVSGLVGICINVRPSVSLKRQAYRRLASGRSLEANAAFLLKQR